MHSASNGGRKERRMKSNYPIREYIVEFLFGSCLCVILVILLAIGIAECQRDGDEAKYNGGVCKCGGHYVYRQAAGHAYDTDYIYICDKCGRMIELGTYRAEREEK